MRVNRAAHTAVAGRVGGSHLLRELSLALTRTANVNSTVMLQGECRSRKGLYYRLQLVEITLPPLRQHREDFALLLQHVMQQLAPRHLSARAGAALRRLGRA